MTETDPAGYVSTGDADGASNGLNTIAVTVPAGVTVTDRNFFDHEKAIIGVAKRVVGQPVNNGNGTYDVTYEILVKNMGTVTLSQVQATDNLAATFAGDGLHVQSVATTANLNRFRADTRARNHRQAGLTVGALAPEPPLCGSASPPAAQPLVIRAPFPAPAGRVSPASLTTQTPSAPCRHSD